MDLDFVSVHKNAKRELGQYPAILTSRLVNNAYVFAVILLYDEEGKVSEKTSERVDLESSMAIHIKPICTSLHQELIPVSVA